MPKSNLLEITRRIDDLASEMEKFVPIGMKGTDGFRADLAGLLVVTIAACYEDCVKKKLWSGMRLRDMLILRSSRRGIFHASAAGLR